MNMLIEGYFKLLKVLIALFLAIMVVLVFGNVVLRYGFNSGITVSEEVSRWLFVWLTFLGAIIALREHGHLGVDMLVRRLPNLGKRACLIISQLLMLYATWLLLQGSWEQTLINWDVAAPASGLSTGWFYGVGIVFGISSGLILLADLYRAVTGRMSDEELVMVKESEEQEEFEALQARRTPRCLGDAWGDPVMTILIFVGSLLGTMAIGMPIAYALLISGIALMIYMDMFDAQIVAQNIINGADSFPLLAVPFFMLAGEIMNTGGLSKRIVNVALALVGHVKGGLGYVAILAACILSALSGSAVADAAALSALLVPMMVQAGHDKARSGGLIAAAGVIGPVIPPSIGFVIFGVVGGVSITKLFLAGLVPGILLGLGLAFAWWWEVRKETIVSPPKKSAGEVGRALRDGVWALVLPFIIIFGLKFGVFTPTEAAVVAAVYSLIIAVFVYRELKLSELFAVFVTSAKTTAVVMLLVAAALVSAWLITVSEIATAVVDLLEPFMDNQTLLLIAIMVLVVIVGTAMDMTPTILILTPILMPVIKAAGIDPVYFGVLFIVNNSIGLITPPVGTVLNVVAGVSRISMEDLMKGVWPFLLAQLVVLFLMVLFPQLVLWPARLIGG
jgi:tripartite ATP-independent transporter DctM subunit